MYSEEIRRKMNREFLVKINRGSKSLLVGWSGLVLEVGRTEAFLLVCRAFDSLEDKWSRKYRSGLRVTFYAK